MGWCRNTPFGFCSTPQVAAVGLPGAGRRLRALATDAAGQLDVLGHDGHALGVDGRQVGVLEQADQVCLGSLLQRQHGAGLEAQVGLEVLGNLTDQALEGQLADEQLRGLLVLADLAQGDRAGAVPECMEGQQGAARGSAGLITHAALKAAPNRMQPGSAEPRDSHASCPHLWGFFTPPVAGADLRAALVASCFRGALPPVDLRAVCLVRAIS